MARPERASDEGAGIEIVWPGKQPRGEIAPGEPLEQVERWGDGAAGQLVVGDCLDVGASLLPSLRGKVDLVYIDPPFATGDEFSGRALLASEGGQRSAKVAAYSDRWADKGSFLSMLWPRLQVAHALLSPEGLMFVHLDDNAVHEVKVLLDELFGARRFRGEIVWPTGNGAKKRSFFSVQHQTLLAYSRGDRWAFDAKHPSLREPYAATSQAMHFTNVDEQGRRFRRRVINGKAYVYYADEGRMVGSVWGDIPAMAANSPISAEATGYPTQKPERLLERLIAACSVEGALVADLFTGSGTTLAVAARLGRRFVGCDRSKLAVATARRRLIGAGVGFVTLEHRGAQLASGAIAPRLTARRRGDDLCIEMHGVTRAGEAALPASVAARSRGPLDEIDLWAVGEIGDGPFVARAVATRAARGEALPPSLTVKAGEGGARVRVVDVLGDVAEATIAG